MGSWADCGGQQDNAKGTETREGAKNNTGKIIKENVAEKKGKLSLSRQLHASLMAKSNYSKMIMFSYRW